MQAHTLLHTHYVPGGLPTDADAKPKRAPAPAQPPAQAAPHCINEPLNAIVPFTVPSEAGAAAGVDPENGKAICEVCGFSLGHPPPSEPAAAA